MEYIIAKNSNYKTKRNKIYKVIEKCSQTYRIIDELGSKSICDEDLFELVDDNDYIYNYEVLMSNPGMIFVKDDNFAFYKYLNDKFYVKESMEDDWRESNIRINILIRSKFKIMKIERELAMYILVNEDIKISKGKLAGQVGHAAMTYLYRNMIKDYDNKLISLKDNDIDFYDEYMQCQKKIILKCPKEKLLELEKEEKYIVIRDKGLTQLEPNTLTCICLGIFDKELCPDWVTELKLY